VENVVFLTMLGSQMHNIILDFNRGQAEMAFMHHYF